MKETTASDSEGVPTWNTYGDDELEEKEDENEEDEEED
jgi:hypothetical protein